MHKNISEDHPFSHNRLKRLKVHWTSWLALIITALIYEALPKEFYWGPHGLMMSLVLILTIPMIILSYWVEHSHVGRTLSLCVTSLITIYMIISVARIVHVTFLGQISASQLLRSAVMLWGTNIFVFALWYWNLDAGGPAKREQIENIRLTAFLFPQAQIVLTESNAHLSQSLKNWQPMFIDYLFLAFNTSTAFSPTDSPVLSRWAKAMFMMQSLISLTIILMLAARAINIINPG